MEALHNALPKAPARSTPLAPQPCHKRQVLNRLLRPSLKVTVPICHGVISTAPEAGDAEQLCRSRRDESVLFECKQISLTKRARRRPKNFVQSELLF
eukprot:4132506-Pyramimonas_sp.AAC.1